MKWVFLIACLFYTKFATANHLTLEKRQAVPSRECASQDNTRALCSPSPEDVWYNGTYVQFTWNLNNAAFTSSSEVDLYLLYYMNTTYKPIKTWPGLTRTSGVLVQVVDDSWYPSLLPENTANVTWHPFGYMVTAGTDYLEEILKGDYSYFPPPVQFTLIQNAHNTTLAAPAPSPSTTQDTGADDEAVAQGGKLKPWMIGVIVAACVIFVIALVALAWLLRRIRKNRAAASQGDQATLIHNTHSLSGRGNGTSVPGQPPTMAGSIHNASLTGLADNRDMSSINSSTPIVLHGGSQRSSPLTATPSRHTDSEKHPTAAQVLQKPEGQPNSILSSTDALMIADTFRQFMRKPEWTERDEDEEVKVGLGDDDLLRKASSETSSPQQPQQQSSSRSTRLNQVTTPSDDL